MNDRDAEIIGGRLGQHARVGAPYRTWWTPVRVLLAAVFFASTLSLVTFSHCRASGWSSPDMYVHTCYSEPAVLYLSAGLDQHRNPFVQFKDADPMNYPILANATAYLLSWLVPTGTASKRQLTYFDLFGLLSIVALAVTTLMAARIVRPWRNALLIALAPAGILALFTGWEAITALLVLLSYVFARRGSPIAAGVLLGVAVLFAFYPVFLLFGFYLGLQRWKIRHFDRITLATLGTWAFVTFLVQLFSPGAGIASLQSVFTSGAGYGSLWLAAQNFGLGTVSHLNFWWLLTTLVSGIALALVIRTRKTTLAQGLLIAALVYFVFAKSFAPQQVLVLIPLAVLAGVKWRDFVIWQGAAVLYHVMLWQYLATVSGAPKGLPADAYAWVTLIHLGAMIYLIVRTIQAMPLREVSVNEEMQHQK